MQLDRGSRGSLVQGTRHPCLGRRQPGPRRQLEGRRGPRLGGYHRAFLAATDLRRPCRWGAGRPLWPQQDLEQIANLLFLDEGMPQGQLWLDLVVVSSPPSLARHIALIDEIGKDLVGAALRDADGAGNVAQPDSGVISDAQQDVGVVRQEVPMPRYWSRRRLPIFSRISVHESMLLCL
jgi:hypothetical protein